MVRSATSPYDAGMASRRDPGALEAEIFGMISAHGAPMTVRALADQAGDGLAYTTIATVLERLEGKGLVRRSRDGRQNVYEAAVDGAAVVARRMGNDLRRSGDRAGVLRHFLSELEVDEARDLQALLKAMDERG